MNIQNYFARHIYNRGVDIYNNGGVYNVVKVGNVYKGKVLGNHEYDVEIEVSDQLKITDMRCTCLYAMKGKKCKHVYDGWREPLCSLYESHHQTAS